MTETQAKNFLLTTQKDMIRLVQLEQKENPMSYYNEMYIPIIDDSVEELADLLYFYEDEDGFENMIKLFNLPTDYVKTDSTERQYIVFKPVTGAIDTLRPRDLDWNWHNRKHIMEIAIVLFLLRTCIIG